MEEKKAVANEQLDYNRLIENLETRIKNNEFKSKEELNTYINSLKKDATLSSLLTEEKILELLNLYDEYHQELPASLDLQNYKEQKFEDNNYIVSTEENEVLKNMNSNNTMPEEFKSVQNKLTSASTTDDLANANTVFNHMKTNEKEQLDFIPITEAVGMSNIDTEVLNKIRFFITNKYIEPYAYRVNPSSGMFYNMETKEMVEVRKDESTGKYEIYKGGEKQYTTDESQENEEDNQTLTEDKDEEKLEYENVKVKKLIKPPENAAFVKNTFIIFIITTFAVLASLILAIIILINK